MHPKGYVCHRAPAKPRLDGSLDCPIWAAAPWTDDFIDICTDVVPRFRTRAKMLWDDEFFYIGAEMEEPNVWATLTEHDSVIFQDNDFEVFIDPDGDNHQYYEIEVNALNTTWDLRLPKPYRDQGSAINEWEAEGMLTAVEVRGTLNDPTDTDDGWSVVLAIPWRALGEFAQVPSPPRPGDRWRVNFSRVEWQVFPGTTKKLPNTPEDNWVWSPQNAVDMHRPEMWGYVQFSDLPAGRIEEFVPDPSWHERETLANAYWKQREDFERTGRYAQTVEGVVVELTSEGFIMRCGSLAIRQDSRIVKA